MKLSVLVEVSEKVRSASKKKEKISLIAGLLGRARGREIYLSAHLLSGRLPSGKIGVGWGMIQNAADGLRPAPSGLELSEVETCLKRLEQASGAGSMDRKRRILGELLSRTEWKERAFLVGLLLGELRQGALEGLVVESISQAASLPVDSIRQGLMFSGDIGEVARAAMEEGASGLGRFGPSLFLPISPMLANPVEGEEEALARLGEAAWEFKIDGARIQVHKSGALVRIFTRHLKDVTESLPEIVAAARGFSMGGAILEGEAVALRPDGRPRPFQTTMRRFGRVLDVARMSEEIPLFPYFFDLLYLDGEMLFKRPYRERFALLSRRLPQEFLITRKVTGSEEEAKAFLAVSMSRGHEGLVAKALDSPYRAGQRGFQWLKIKPSKTLDLVILAAEWGHGRRKGWLSNLHLGARDPESGGFVMLGKTFKGLTDEMLGWLTEKLLALEIGRDAYTVYVRPELVAEIAYSGLQESPRYPGGLALRFARVRSFRPDKIPQEADTIQTVWALFEASRS